jgi:tetratricopeptide (TPR) repeat protein
MNPPNLSSCIVKSLKEREMSADLASALLNKNRTEALRHDETEYWDYKETIDLENPLEIARLAKRVLAFHNNRGGVIIYGVRDNYDVSGVAVGKTLDANKLNQKLRQYIGTSFSLFQDSIAVPNSKVLWLVFVPSKESIPIAVASNGPLNDKNRNEIRKGEFYVRVNDTVKLCVEPNEIYRLLGNVSLSHIEAYLYDVDEPYFRLLAPHCERFVGRQDQLNKVRDALFKSRHPIIALDGVGGVGKSAIAIEIVRSLYDAQKFMFVVSQSAKSKVWHEHMATRKAGFSGLTEFLYGIADVLALPREKELENLKASVAEAMSGLEGLLLVDNIEDISDKGVFNFLLYEVPDPVKVLVTSRVDKGLGALTISIPQMPESEARELLYEELKRVGFKDVYSDNESVNQIIKATGKIPLALKWAALLAASNQSLKDASHRLRKLDATKKEFLSFCFATMFDEISRLAQDVAVLGVYLENNCNTTTLSVVLDKSDDEIEEAFVELRAKGILLDNFSDSRKALSFLPLTEDFLANKWNENKSFREKALARMKLKGINFNQTVEERFSHVRERIQELKNACNYKDALQQVEIALSLDPQNSSLLFLRGDVLYDSGRKREGLNLMQFVVAGNEENPTLLDEQIRLSLALIEYGTAKTTKEGLRILKLASEHGQLPPNAVNALIKASLELRDYRGISGALFNLNSASEAAAVAQAVKPYLQDREFIYRCAGNLPRMLRLALGAADIAKEQKSEFQRQIQTIEKILKEGRDFN